MNRRQLNREMKKLGFLPVKGKAFRPVKPLVRCYTDGETAIGIGEVGASRRRMNLLPLVNRTMFTNAYSNPGDAETAANSLVWNATKTLE